MGHYFATMKKGKEQYCIVAKLIGTRMVSRHQAPCLSGFPLYGYLMTVSTLIFAFFIPRFELFRVE